MIGMEILELYFHSLTLGLISCDHVEFMMASEIQVFKWHASGTTASCVGLYISFQGVILSHVLKESSEAPARADSDSRLNMFKFRDTILFRSLALVRSSASVVARQTKDSA